MPADTIAWPFVDEKVSNDFLCAGCWHFIDDDDLIWCGDCDEPLHIACAREWDLDQGIWLCKLCADDAERRAR